ncbi:hypothetical protein DFP73DRAFT_487405 [Morchella snyderi]|nr:hypothetical protein DFP73DRAFT_487405 [Morchella snyderi]
MVSTRKSTRSSSGLSEEPAVTSPTKSSASRKRKTEENAPESVIDGPKHPTKQAKKATVEDEGKNSPKQTTLDSALKQQPRENDAAGDVITGERSKGAEGAQDQTHEDEEQLQNESKCAITVSSEREEKVKNSPIMEKGIIYFFFRPKVAVDHAESIDDVQRSYIVLRPLPLGAKLNDGKVGDSDRESHHRLIAIPKKRLPGRGYERFLTFVEEPKISAADLKSRFLKGSTYMTKTQGERKNSPMEPIGEGIYALAKTEEERSTHLAYILTLPSTPDELQKDFGLKSRGSFVVNVRNPQTPAPPQAGIPDPAEYSKEIMEEFRGLKWGALEPKHLDYKHAEVLFIGESGSEVPGEGKHEGTSDEMEKLEGEDEVRVRHLEGDEAIFADLELDRKEFGGVESTW